MRQHPLRVFISYSRKDTEFVDALQSLLTVHGIEVWLDRSRLEGGQLWKDMLEEAITACDVFLLISSPASLTSHWVRQELRYALLTGSTAASKRLVRLIYRPSETAAPFEQASMPVPQVVYDPQRPLADQFVPLLDALTHVAVPLPYAVRYRIVQSLNFQLGRQWDYFAASFWLLFRRLLLMLPLAAILMAGTTITLAPENSFSEYYQDTTKAVGIVLVIFPLGSVLFALIYPRVWRKQRWKIAAR